MTPEQYDRWQDFAARMAKTYYASSKRPSAAWVLGTVEDFFANLDEHLVECIRNWDHSEPYPPGHPYVGHVDYLGRAAHPSGAGDELTLFLEDYEGYAPRCRVCREYESTGECRCEEIDKHRHEQWQDQWGGPIHCCVRAGLDMASAPSAGVLGLTKGDLKRMYPEGIPDWVFPPGEQLHYWPGGELNGTFAELEDSAGLVL